MKNKLTMSQQELCSILQDATKQINELKHRLELIEVDVKVFKQWAIEKELNLFQPTDYADYAWSHIENIVIASDVKDATSLTWTND